MLLPGEEDKEWYSLEASSRYWGLPPCFSDGEYKTSDKKACPELVSGQAFINSYIFFSRVRIGFFLLNPPATSASIFLRKDQPSIAPAYSPSSVWTFLQHQAIISQSRRGRCDMIYMTPPLINWHPSLQSAPHSISPHDFSLLIKKHNLFKMSQESALTCPDHGLEDHPSMSQCGVLTSQVGHR